MIYIVIVLTALLVYQGIVGYLNKRDLIVMLKESHVMIEKFNTIHQANYVEWSKERQQLIDRIQAPSFDHLKQAEVRVIKAQKEEKKDETRLEPV